MTDEQIVETLECYRDSLCIVCPCENCKEDIFGLAIGLINRQSGKILKLKAHIKRLQTRNDELNILNKTAVQEAIKEFAERLIRTADGDDEYGTVFVFNIKDLVKEMTEGK